MTRTDNFDLHPGTEQWEQERDDALSGTRPDVSLMAVDQYFHWLHWSSRLAVEQEGRLVQRLRRGLEERLKSAPNQWVLSLAKHARESLVESYQGLVVHIAEGYYRRVHVYAGASHSIELLDAIQNGNEGLLQAMEVILDYPTYPFERLAALHISHAVYNGMAMDGASVHFDAAGATALLHLHDAMRTFHQEQHCAPTVDELVEQMHLPKQKVMQLLEWHALRHCESLQAVVVGRQVDEEDRYPLESVHGASAALVESDERVQALYQAMRTCLRERECEIVRSRYGLDRPRGTHEEIAAYFGMSRRGVQEAVRRSKERLSLALTSPAPVGRFHKRSYTLADVTERTFYTVKEAARLLGITRQVLEKCVKLGLIPYEYHEGKRIQYRFPKQAIDDLAAAANEQECYTVEEAARYLGVTSASVYRYVQQGRLESIRRTVSRSTHSSVLFVPKSAVHSLAAARRARRSALVPSVVA